MTIRHLNQIELSRRWGISHRTLERWRHLNEGPSYIKIGGRVVYRLEDVEQYELAHTRNPSQSMQSSMGMGGMQ
ncbi:helix-turn-helix transcriptional regulator [Magnetococcus sp. PR-3]|uniref:helix-turn-helix transcriptional regulator n=1 Tax=Magnetococcus sp. PR-3 TaxID=3120355 RepID=UPI002FCE3F3E